jgi:hypothetical protein
MAAPALMRMGYVVAYLFAMFLAGLLAYDIRLYAIRGCELQAWPPQHALPYFSFFLFSSCLASVDLPTCCACLAVADGTVIHEFDPWFNYRATEYLDVHGWHKFFHWFDYESWYPLGRPVGTTIYPGMQITSVAIKRVLNALGNPISLNDVCCYVPAW